MLMIPSCYNFVVKVELHFCGGKWDCLWLLWNFTWKKVEAFDVKSWKIYF